ncbi:MAG: TetR/AcrR family transcriptional regulator [Steroidobacteraceae bacterium]
MPTLNSDSPRSRGRPVAGRNTQRSRLLQAGRELLAEGAELTLGRAAMRAGVTPALANYYFLNRAGLVGALLQERAAPRVDDLIGAARVRADQPVAALTFLMQRLTSVVATDPFVCRCLLLQEGRPLRERLRAVLRELLQRAQREGQLRADLPLEYLGDTLLGLCLFPFLDSDAAGSNAGERVAALTLQHVALLQDGIVRAQRPRHESAS